MLDSTNISDLIRRLDPATIEPSDAELDAALARVRAGIPQLKPAPRKRRALPVSSLVVSLSGLVLVIGVGLASFAVFSGSPSGVSEAWARQLIARVAAANTPPRDGILHIVDRDTVNVTGPHARHRSGTSESWQQETPPYDFWASSPNERPYMAVVNGKSYQHQTWGELWEQKLTPREVRVSDNQFDPAWEDLLNLLGSGPAYESYGQLVSQVIKTDQVSVNPHANLDGHPAISITHKRAGTTSTFYVSRHTYRPLTFIREGNNGSGYFRQTDTFTTYEILPDGSVTPPNMPKLYPHSTQKGPGAPHPGKH